MPQLGETVTEGTITRWFKSVGDAVARDEPLFEVSTDKVDSEVPAPAAGTLTEIRVPEGETVEVGVVLAVIGEGASAPGAAPAAQAPAAQAPTAQAPTAQAPAEAAPTGAAPAGAAPAAPVAAAPPPAAVPEPAPPVPAEAPPSPAAPPVTGPASTDGLRAEPAAAGAEGGPAGAPLLLSPVVRRLLAENAIDPAQVRGTGPGGRITRADVLAEVDARRAGGAPAEAARRGNGGRAAPGPALPVAAAPAGAEDEVVPFTNIRRRTAEHMVRSKATSAHTLVVAEADFEAVDRVRRDHGERFRAEEGFGLTYLPFVARATVEALHRWPHLNASVGADELVVHRRVNLGIAVDLSFEGLVAPVVHGADELTVRGLARRIRDLADRARTKRLSPDDLTGGTFTITNPGPFGTLITGPIINQPQVGIVSTDTVKRRPVAVVLPDGTEAVAIHSVGLLSLTWDHRAVDGAYAAAFLHDVTEMLAGHDWSAEL